jgi:hypothetical protein
VQTDTGNEGARKAGTAEATDTMEDSAAFVAKTVTICFNFSGEGSRTH